MLLMRSRHPIPSQTTSRSPSLFLVLAHVLARGDDVEKAGARDDVVMVDGGLRSRWAGGESEIPTGTGTGTGRVYVGRVVGMVEEHRHRQKH